MESVSPSFAASGMRTAIVGRTPARPGGKVREDSLSAVNWGRRKLIVRGS